MSDDPTQADEADVTEQGSGGEQPHEDRSWLIGDPDPDRLVSYASNLRKERAELKERLSKADVWEDEDAVFERVRERFPHWLEPDGAQETDDDDETLDDPDEDGTPKQDPRVDELLQWKQQQDAEREAARFETDLKGFVADRELSKQADRAIRLEAATGNLGPAELKKLVDEWIEYEAGLKQSGIEDLKSSKKAPHVPAGGNASRGPQPDVTTQQGRSEFFKQRLAGHQP